MSTDANTVRINGLAVRQNGLYILHGNINAVENSFCRKGSKAGKNSRPILYGIRLFCDIIKQKGKLGSPCMMMEEKKGTPAEGVIAGRNAVTEALRSGRPIDSIYVARGDRSGSIAALTTQAKEKNIPVKEASPQKLNHLCAGAVHQGVAAVAAAKEYASVEEILALAQKRGEPPFLILADGLEDPHNLGAVLRVAECAGAHGVVIPKRRSVGLTWAVGKASAGAVEYVPVARVANLAATIDDLKKRGVWIYAADPKGQSWCGTDFSGPAAVVIGSEGFGVSRLVREKADFVISLPMLGKINSLNASVACGIICYEIVRQRHGIKTK
jgi:23S rRNA (guanosine2251-2'-O)-methyltransferase